MSYNLVNPTTGALTKVSGNISSNIIPVNASANNKLVTKSDTAKRKDVVVTATASIENDIKALLDELIAETSGPYIGSFTRTGNTSGHYSMSVVSTWNAVGIVSICGATSAAYRVAKFKNTEQGAYTYQIVKLAADSTRYECAGFLVNSLEGEITGYGRATVTLKDGIAEIKFSVRIHTNDGPATFNWGLNRDLLHTSANQFWVPARMYQIDGSTGTWGTDRFPINSYITGTVYGVYTV